MKELLGKYTNLEIGVNIVKPLHVELVTLKSVHDEYFTVAREKDGNAYHVPYLNIVKVIEIPDGAMVGGFFTQKKSYVLIVKIGHLVEYTIT